MHRTSCRVSWININSVSLIHTIAVITLLGLINTYAAATANYTKDLRNNTLLHSSSGSNVDNDVAAADSGMVYLIGTAANTEIDTEQVAYYSGINCDDGTNMIDIILSSGGFTFTSGNTYYQDATGLFDLANNMSVIPATIRSAKIVVSNSLAPASLSYCIPNLVCNTFTNRCINGGATDVGIASDQWAFEIP